MTDLRQAAQQALEALESKYIVNSGAWQVQRDQAITALRAALAEPEQKVWCDCGDSIEPDSGAKCGNCVAGDSAEPEQEPVAWVELTDEEQLELARDSMGRSRHWLVAQVEAKLKEKNT